MNVTPGPRRSRVRNPRRTVLCKGFAATTLFRLSTSAPAAQTWDCMPIGKGWVCGFEGEAVCGVEERRIQEEESCGPSFILAGDRSSNPGARDKRLPRGGRFLAFYDEASPM